MRGIFTFLGMVALLQGLAPTARADLITIDARSYEFGTNLTHVGPGLRMQAIVNSSPTSYAPTYTDIFADPNWDGGFYEPGTGAFYFDSGPRFYFGEINDFLACSRSGSNCSTAYAVLELSFSSPLDHLMIGGNDPADPLAFVGFDDRGNVSANCGTYLGPQSGCNFSPGLDGRDQRLVLDNIDGDVYRVWAAFAFQLGTINQVSYSLRTASVPEPGTLGLLGAGLVGLGFAGRRKVT